MLFYFTGTGNSLYVARELDDAPLSIPQVMHQKERYFSDATIGIVSPVYGHEVPEMVRWFLRESDFQTDYFYMILTYGNRYGGATELARQLCEECGIRPSYINVMLMVDNWLPGFNVEEQQRLDKDVDGQLAAIHKDLQQRRKWIAPVTEKDRLAHQQFLTTMASAGTEAWQHLIRITEACVGCGVCSRVCPSGSIYLEGERAVFMPGHCQTCLACVHACPQKAIGLTVPEKNPQARYRNPDVTLQEIMRANAQEQ